MADCESDKSKTKLEVDEEPRQPSVKSCPYLDHGVQTSLTDLAMTEMHPSRGLSEGRSMTVRPSIAGKMGEAFSAPRTANGSATVLQSRFLHAAEWSRTITGVSTHKALNLARLPVPPQPPVDEGF
jgi:hypothetical protein